MAISPASPPEAAVFTVTPTFRAIVAECPYADLRTLAEHRVRGMSPLPQWISADLSHLIVGGGMIYARARYGLDFAQVSPTSAIAQANAPILLIHGMQDQKTPFWHSQRLARANPRAVLWLVPNADHTAAASADPTGFRARVLGWFAQH